MTVNHGSDKMKKAVRSESAALCVAIRDPLNAGLGLLHSLEKTALDERQSEIVSNIRETMAEFRDIADRMEGLRQLYDGVVKLHPERTDLKALFADIAADFEPRSRSRGVSFDMIVRETVPQAIDIDGARLDQAIRHVMNIALEAQSISLLNVQVSASGQSLTVVVSDDCDSGPDAPPRDEMVAMCIARATVAEMGGNVGCSCRNGVGNSVEFSIPITSQQSVARAAGDVDYFVDAAGLRVLVADDQPTNRRVMDAYLSKWKIKADFAENGETALNFAMRNEYDIILMDINMPVMNGVEATQAIREHNSVESDTFVVAQTADVFFQDSDEAFLFDAFLSKPVTPERLFSILERIALKRQRKAA